MAIGTWHTDFGPRAETDLYLKRARQMGKSLIIASTQRMDSGLMVVSQRTKLLRVVVEQQANTYPQVINAQRTYSDLMDVLQ